MMNIFVNNQELDLITGQAVEINWQNIRFSSAIADKWSTDINMPATPRNMAILGLAGLLDGNDRFNKRVKCGIRIDDTTEDGYLHVTNVTKDEITATAYLCTIPYELYDRELSEYVRKDDDSSIFRFDAHTVMSTSIAPLGVWPYDYNYDGDYRKYLAQRHPAVNVNTLLGHIAEAENVTLPTVPTDLYVLSSGRNICPQNRRQNIVARKTGKANTADERFKLFGGQHVTNDLNCNYTPDNVKFSENMNAVDDHMTVLDCLAGNEVTKITFNRHAKFNIRVYGTTDRGTISMKLLKNGQDITVTTAGYPYLFEVPINGDSSGEWSTNDALCYIQYGITVEDGDYIEFASRFHDSPIYAATQSLAIIIEYTEYQIDDDDYGKQLNYIGVNFGLLYAYRNRIGAGHTSGYRFTVGGSGKGQSSPLDYSFCYFGTYANLKSMKIRDLLTSLCWIVDEKLKLKRYELLFDSAYSSKVISGNITHIQTYSDKLGQANVIKYANGTLQHVFDIDNEFVENSVDIHTSAFNTTINRYGAATIKQYEIVETKDDDGDTTTSVDFTDVGATLLTLPTVSRLEPAPRLTDFALSELTTVVECTIDTFDDVYDIDYVILDGHKYMVVDGTWNGVYSTLNTLLIPSQYVKHCAPPTVEGISISAYSDSVTVQFDIVDGTGTFAGQAVVYDDGMAEVYRYDIMSGANYVHVDNLSPDSSYSIQIDGESECGTLSKTIDFRTRVPVVVSFRNVGATQSGEYTVNATAEAYSATAEVDSVGIMITPDSGFTYDVQVRQLGGQDITTTFDGLTLDTYHYRAFATVDGNTYYSQAYTVYLTHAAPTVQSITVTGVQPGITTAIIDIDLD